MNINEFNALIRLLDDPDPQVFYQVKKRFTKEGRQILPLLQKEWNKQLSMSEILKIEEIINVINFSNFNQTFKDLLTENPDNILDGFLILTKFYFPDVETNIILQEIEKIKKDIWLEMNFNLTALEKIKIFNHFFYDIHNFKISYDFKIQNTFLNNILVHKSGNPISLGILYAFFAQQTELPVFGVNAGNKFLLAYLDAPIFKIADIKKNNILFFIDPTNNGKLLDSETVELTLLKGKKVKDSDEIKPFRNLFFIRYWLTYSIVMFQKLGYQDKVKELQQIWKSFVEYSMSMD